MHPCGALGERLLYIHLKMDTLRLTCNGETAVSATQETLGTPPRGHLASVDGRTRHVVVRVLGFRGGLRVTPAGLGDAGCAHPHCIAGAGTPGWPLALRRDPLSVWAMAQDWRFFGARPWPVGSVAGPYRRVLRWMLCEERACSCHRVLGTAGRGALAGGQHSRIVYDCLCGAPLLACTRRAWGLGWGRM